MKQYTSEITPEIREAQTPDNGDEIISTPQSSVKLVFRDGRKFPEGFLTMPGSKH